MPDLFHAGLLAGNALILSLTCALYARTKYHASLARTAAHLARADRCDAKRFADSAAGAVMRAAADEPVILPFKSAPVFAPQPAAPKLFTPDGSRDADEYVGA